MNDKAAAAARYFHDSPLGAWIVFALMLAAFNAIFAPFFPLPDYRLGHDFSFVMPNLLDGEIWFRNNGLAVPWFTPSFCAGQPFFPDPQSSYYALPQVLSFLVSPLTAIRWTLLAAASLMYWGGYLLMRRVFQAGMASALLVGGLLMFNGFLPHRMIVGHVGYHGFALAPWIALLLMMNVRHAANGIAAAVGAGVLLAYWVQSGLGTLIPAAGLAILLLAIVHGLTGGSLGRFFGRGLLAGLVALGLSAAKLSASFSFLAAFPRTDYLLPGAASIADAAIVIAGGLLLPSQWAYHLGTPRMANVQWALLPHEWAFNFSTILLLLAAALAVGRLGKRVGRPTVSPRQAGLWALMALCLAWPLAFCVWDPAWNAFLKTVPMINSTSTPLRWLIVYIPIAAVGLGVLLDKARWGQRGVLAAAVCLVATVAQTASEPRDFYEAQAYDARPILIADALLRDGKLTPRIDALGTAAAVQAGEYRAQLQSNNTLIAGMSQLRCYNPVFGYGLEKFSTEGLMQGPVLQERDGFLNLKNPVCYVYPDQNDCRPGDLFRAAQLAQAKDFVEYKPFAFQFSPRQTAANLVTQLSLLGLVLAVLLWLGWTASRLLRARRPKSAHAIRWPSGR